MSEVTTGDRVWRSVLVVLARQASVTVSGVREEMDEPPSRQTVYRRLEALTDLNVLEKEAGRGSAPSVYRDPNADKRPETGEAQPQVDYPLYVHNVGGREPDGSPTYIGPWTFSTRMVRDVVEDAIEGRTLNACAGKTELEHDGEIVRNDLNPEMEADMHVDVMEIDQHFEPDSFNSIVYDPPFDQEQAREHYDGMHDTKRGPARRKLMELVRPGGIFVELGWNDHGPGLGYADDWYREECHRYRRGPSYQPIFLTVDRRRSLVVNSN